MSVKHSVKLDSLQQSQAQNAVWRQAVSSPSGELIESLI